MTEPSETPPPPPGHGTPPPGYGTPPPGYGTPPVGGYQQPGGYPPPGYAYGQYPYQQVRGTNVLAIVALVSIFVFTPAALVLGIIARNQIKQTGEQGDGMALAAIIVGALAVAFFALLFLFFFGAFALST